MTEKKFVKFNPINAQLLSELINLDDTAQQLLKNSIDTVTFLQALLAGQHYAMAVSVLAHALPKREATWWACLSARKHLTENSPKLDAQAIALAEAWVYKPSEENRKALLPIAQQLPPKSPATWAALAAFWSGNNMSLNPEVVIPPPDYLTAKAVISAVITSAVNDTPEKINSNYQLFLQQGIDIACGGDGRINTTTG